MNDKLILIFNIFAVVSLFLSIFAFFIRDINLLGYSGLTLVFCLVVWYELRLEETKTLS